ncbi:sporulation integral membrane protein YtvI [Fervidibacillus halotolerans]|uniref:Sporulation integral membrane protein YtvI n=1 Tax=Fervidibacillus halotolerans TaxID=2980027 RepID=A0A9E8LXQ3_9BACI|nr:sporulation integral membrane protein YtvI [Fervidibacillus halotolerans]WAA11663.1 sporulation integral membrane protein YtvI [Fervidibacillus halotolerans]
MIPVFLQRSLRFLFVIIAMVFIIIAGYFIATLTYPFIFAWIIAFLMNPLVNFVQVKGKVPRPLSVLIVMIAFFSLIVAFFIFLISELISGTEYLAKTLPSQIVNLTEYIEKWIMEKVVPFFNQISTFFETLGKDQQNQIVQNIQSIGTELATTIGSLLQSLLTKIPTVISWFPNAATVLILTILATFFISKDWYKLKKDAGKWIPIKIKDSSMKVYLDLRRALFGFIRAQLTLISITAIIVLLGLLILRIDHAVTIAIFIGFIDLLPYLGTGFVFVPWIIYEMISQNYSLGIGLAVLYVIVIVQRQLMEPKVVSTNIGISPLGTLVALFVGLKLFGVIGLIIGPIIAVIIVALYKANIFHDLWNFIKG